MITMPHTAFLDGYINGGVMTMFLTACLMALLVGAYFAVVTEVTYKRQPLWWRFGLTTGLFVLLVSLSFLLLSAEHIVL